MNDQILHRLSNWLWTAIVIFIVSLAFYVSVGRFLMNNIAQVQTDLLREVNARLNFVVEVDDLRGGWESLSPYLELKGVRVAGSKHRLAAVEVRELRLGFNVLGSLASRSLQLYSLVADDVDLHGDIDSDGKLSLPGVPSGEALLVEQFVNFVLNTEHLGVTDFEASLHYKGRERHLFGNFQLLRDRQFRRLNASLFNPDERSRLRILAEGHGNPMKSKRFDADMHVHFRASDAESYSDLAELFDMQIFKGNMESELWLNIRAGELRAAASVAASDFHFSSPGDDEAPIVLDSLSALVRLDRKKGVWEFGASDIQLSGAEQQFLLDGVSGTFENQRLEFQVADIDAGSLVDYALTERLLPTENRDLLAVLAPSGHFTRMQVTVENVSRFRASWELEANFDNLSVASWRNTPAIKNGSGFLRLGQNSGVLQLDAHDFGMGLPAVYEHMLDYRDFRTELAFSLEDNRLDFWSGRFIGNSDEGQVTGLFALTVPFDASSTRGIEMDLVVGLENGHPRSRNKYLPYTLPSNLLAWLETSLGEGLITEGGFIYRGSLRKGLIPHRSIQLFFDVQDTELNYHPEWPSLSSLDATLFIDNKEVRGFAREARLFDSQVRGVEVNIEPDVDGRLSLRIQGSLSGPAQDGLRVVNNSPLRQLTGDTFDDWELDGSLVADVQLGLSLNDLSQAPVVDLSASFEDVHMHTGKLGVEVESVTGVLDYRTDTGFSASSVSGNLWGQPLTGQITQGLKEDDGGLGDLDIHVAGLVHSDSLRDWLQLDMLRVAKGTTNADIHIIVPPGGQPRIEVATMLEGVSLDLPEQFAKTAQTSRPLQLIMPLTNGSREMTLVMDNATWLNLRFGGGELMAASIGFTRSEPADQDNHLVIGGELERFEWDAWHKFAEDYVFSETETAKSDAGMSLTVRDLQVGEARAFGQAFADVTLSARQKEALWELDYAFGWLRGKASFTRDLSELSLQVNYLDIDTVPESLLSSLEQGEGVSWELPDTDVVISGLHSGGQALGQVQFTVQQNGDNYHFARIEGDLRGLLLGGDEEFTLDWRRSGGEPVTSLRGPARFVNFGDVLEGYAYDEIMETNSGAFALDMTWPGAPNDFSLAGTRGRVGVAIDEGSFLKSSAAAEGTLRVMGILNLAEFVRRLSFDMNYLFKSGIPFDSITGELLFEKGQIEVPQMDVLGVSSRFQFVGLIDVNDATIAGELVTTLPVASNLPWIAALIGGLPAAAGVYVVSKVFTEQVDRFSSGIYSIDGPWEDPQVKFERIFDNTASHKQAVAEADIEINEEAGAGESTVDGTNRRHAPGSDSSRK